MQRLLAASGRGRERVEAEVAMQRLDHIHVILRRTEQREAGVVGARRDVLAAPLTSRAEVDVMPFDMTLGWHDGKSLDRCREYGPQDANRPAQEQCRAS